MDQFSPQFFWGNNKLPLEQPNQTPIDQRGECGIWETNYQPGTRRSERAALGLPYQQQGDRQPGWVALRAAVERGRNRGRGGFRSLGGEWRGFGGGGEGAAGRSFPGAGEGWAAARRARRRTRVSLSGISCRVPNRTGPSREIGRASCRERVYVLV